MADDILWLATIPVSCPECGQDAPQTIGRMIQRERIACPYCGAPIDLQGEQWRTFIKQLAERLRGLEVPVTKRNDG